MPVPPKVPFLSINNTGQVAGSSETSGEPSRAFIMGPNGAGMRDLGTLGGSDSFVTSMNDAGQVVGSSTTANGVTLHAFITGPMGWV